MAERSRGGDGRFVPGTPAWGSGPNAGPPVGTTERSSSNPPLMGKPLEPVEPVAPSPKTDLYQEYIAGGNLTWYSRLVKALPPAIDDITGDFGDDLYEKMLWDPQIAACMAIMKAAILEDGIHLQPAIDDDSTDGYELAKTIFEEAEQMVDDFEEAIEDSLWDMLGAIARGNRVAELKWRDADPRNGSKSLINVVSLKVKPRRATAFVVDPYFNLVGLLGRPPGFPSPFLASWLVDPDNPPPNLIPRTRFAILTHRPQDGDPRGTSILRPAYEPWWRKRQVYPEYLKYLATFAGPSLWATTPDKAQPQPRLDADGVPIPGTPLMTPEQVLFNALQGLRNGYVGAFPFGTTINSLPVQAARALDPFLQAVTASNLEITKAILTQNLATEEGMHQARAAAEVHEDVLDTLVRQGKHTVQRMLVRDVLRQWVAYNWGDQAKRLVPKVSLGVTEERDRSSLIGAIASLANAKIMLADGSTIGYITGSQLQELDEMLGIPVRESDEVPPSPAELRAQAEQRAQQQLEIMKAAAAAKDGQQQPGEDSSAGGAQSDGGTSERSGSAPTQSPAKPSTSAASSTTGASSEGNGRPGTTRPASAAATRNGKT